MTWQTKGTPTWSEVSRARREERFDRYTELLELGYSPEVACERLGVKVGALMRQLYRARRHELARPLAALANRARRARRTSS